MKSFEDFDLAYFTFAGDQFLLYFKGNLLRIFPQCQKSTQSSDADALTEQTNAAEDEAARNRLAELPLTRTPPRAYGTADGWARAGCCLLDGIPTSWRSLDMVGEVLGRGWRTALLERVAKPVTGSWRWRIFSKLTGFMPRGD